VHPTEDFTGHAATQAEGDTIAEDQSDGGKVLANATEVDGVGLGPDGLEVGWLEMVFTVLVSELELAGHAGALERSLTLVELLQRACVSRAFVVRTLVARDRLVMFPAIESPAAVWAPVAGVTLTAATVRGEEQVTDFAAQLIAHFAVVDVEEAFGSATSFAPGTLRRSVRSLTALDWPEFLASLGAVLGEPLTIVERWLRRRDGRGLQQGRFRVNAELAIVGMFVLEVVARTDVLAVVVDDLEDDRGGLDQFIGGQFPAEPADKCGDDVYSMSQERSLLSQAYDCITIHMPGDPLFFYIQPLSTADLRGEESICPNALQSMKLVA